MTKQSYFAGIELGGTKSLAILAHGRDIVDLIRLPTLSPAETLGALRDQLRGWQESKGFRSLGIASFGPLQLDAAKPSLGVMLDTPKAGWSSANVAGELTAGLTCPWAIDTDVNGAALAEYHWGAGQGCDSLCYITIGTGVGGGLVIGGHAVHGAMHPEIGHLRLRRSAGDDFEGNCPFHGDCIEGLISGPALARRFSGDPALIPDEDARWRHVASDIAELASAILFTTSAQRILVGGGIGIARPGLIETARGLVVARAGRYLPFIDKDTIQTVLSLPALGDQAGPLGAIALAMRAKRACAG